MKKRVLSVLLALTLCFTVFASSGFAVKLDVEKKLDQVDKALTERAVSGANEGNDDTQQSVIDSAVEHVQAIFHDPEYADLREEIMSNIISTPEKEAEHALVTQVMFETASSFEENITLSYFVLRMLGEEEVDAETYPKLAELISEFKRIDVKYDTSKDTIKQSFDKFSSYGDELTDLYKSYMHDTESQIELFLYMGLLDGAPEQLMDEVRALKEQGYTPEQAFDALKAKYGFGVDRGAAMNALMEKGREFALAQADEIVEYVILGVLLASYDGVNGDGPYVSMYKEAMANDVMKKNAAILVGEDLLRFGMGGGFKKDGNEYIKARQNKILDLVMKKKAGLFDEDKAVVYSTVNEIIADLIVMVKADMMDTSLAIQPKLVEGVQKLYDRSLTIDGLYATVLYLIEKLEIKDFLNIWYNLGLSYLVQAEVTCNQDADENGQYTAMIDLEAYHKLILDRVPDFEYPVSANVNLQFAEEQKDMEIVSMSGFQFINYTPADKAQTVTLNVYRGADAVDGWDVDRYIKQIDVTLAAKKDEPTPDVDVYVTENYEPKALTVDLGTAIDEIKGLPTEVTLSTAGGKTTAPIAIDGWTSEDYDGTVAGTYTLVGTYKKPANTATENYDAVDGKVEVKVTVTTVRYAKITNKDAFEGTVYAPGAEVKVEMDVKNLDLVILAIAEKGEKFSDGAGYDYVTLTAEEANKGYTFKAPDKFGEYTIAVGNQAFEDVDGNVTTDETWFKVDEQIIDEPVVLQKESFTGKNRSYARKTAWSTIKADLESSTTHNKVTLIPVNADDKSVVASVTWSGELLNGGEYDPNATTAQTVVGRYEVPEGYEVDTAYEGSDKIDGIVTINITRSTPGPNGGGVASKTRFADGTGYDQKNTIRLIGETNDTKVVVRLVGPNGEVLKTVTLTRAEFLAGYDWDISDIAPLADGEYTLELRSTATKSELYDTYTFAVGYIRVSDLFTKDHVNYILGFEDGTVRPEATITRDEVAAILFRLLSDKARNDYLTESTDKFTDLTEDRWSMTAFATLNTAGIFLGRGNGLIGAGDDITRSEFAALVSRFAIKSTGDLANPYADISGHWAENEIKAVTAAGWFQGDGSGNFRPDDKMTRAEVVTVMNRLLGRNNVNAESFEGKELVQFADLTDTNAWYYVDMVEASNAHDFDKVNGVESWKAIEEKIDWTVYED